MATAKKAAPKKSAVTSLGLQAVKPVKKVNRSIKWDADNFCIMAFIGNDEYDEFTPSVDTAEIGCAIRQYGNVQNTLGAAWEFLAGDKTISAAQRDKEVENVAIEMLIAVKKDENAAFLLCSNNYTSNSSKAVNAILDKLCNSCSDVVKSPKTKSQIRVWVI